MSYSGGGCWPGKSLYFAINFAVKLKLLLKIVSNKKKSNVSLRLYPVEKEMATHSGILAWRIPWTQEPGRLQSMGSQESDMTEWLRACIVSADLILAVFIFPLPFLLFIKWYLTCNSELPLSPLFLIPQAFCLFCNDPDTYRSFH